MADEGLVCYYLCHGASTPKGKKYCITSVVDESYCVRRVVLVLFKVFSDALVGMAITIGQ